MTHTRGNIMINEPHFTDDENVVKMIRSIENLPCKDSVEDNEPCLTCPYLETCNL